MQVNVEQLSSVKKKINFEVSAERVKAETQKAFAEIRKKAAVPGFRKGKAPESMIRQAYRGQVENDVVKNLFNDCYFTYIQENNIYPVAHPEIDADPLEDGAPFKFSATVEVYPEVVVNNYEGFELAKEKFALDPQAVDRRLDQMRDNMSQLQPLAETRPAAAGDHVVIDFTGYTNGEALEGGSATDHLLELGSNSFIPGFEEQLAGMNVGDQKRISLTFPDPYHSAELAGKPVDFDVTLKEIKVKEVPELDDAFAQGFGEFNTLDELKAKIAETIEKQERDRIDREFKDGIIKQLIEKNDFELPDTMVERQLGSMLENTKQRLQYQGMTLEMMGLDEQRYKEQFRSVAAGQVKGALLLHSLAEKVGVKVGDAEVEAKLQKMSADAGQDYERMSKFYLQNADAKRNLEEQVREELVLDLIAGKGTVVEKDKSELTAAEA